MQWEPKGFGSGGIRVNSLSILCLDWEIDANSISKFETVQNSEIMDIDKFVSGHIEFFELIHKLLHSYFGLKRK